MKMERIRRILQNGEGLTVEFKESKNKLNKDIFETVCAFLNRNSGELLLGVNDNGEVVGVDNEAISQIKKDFATSMNNPQKINPTFYLSAEEIEINNKTILYIYIPESSQVHRCNGRIFDRNEDGDFDITDNTNLVSAMYMRKQCTYTENRIYPFAQIEDLRNDLFLKVRKLASNQRPNHPWQEMNDFELLKSAGLYFKDYQSGQEGLTLAAVLLLGKDELIFSVIPNYRTDAILRREDTDRYDDRDDIRTNLIESYERLMRFIAKHLKDKFYLEKDQRVSIRDKIFREVVSNILIHREYFNPYPAKLIINGEKVFAENSNKPHRNGIIDPSNFSPYPKNPTIARFFKEIGWVEELGSGVRNIYKYSKLYSEKEPLFIEKDIFKTIIPLAAQATAQATMQATAQADEEIKRLLEFCKIPRSRDEMQKFMNLNHREHFRKKILNPLIESGLLKLTMPEKPTSPKQKYYSGENQGDGRPMLKADQGDGSHG